MKQFLKSLPLLFLVSGSFAMEPSQEMQHIRSWDDVTPFNGKIVIYEGQCYSLMRKGEGYIINNNALHMRAGFIDGESNDDSGLRGYILRRLLKKGACNSHCALNNSLINQNKMVTMRLANQEEKDHILAVCTSGEAEFDYTKFGLIAYNTIGFMQEKVMQALRETQVITEALSVPSTEKPEYPVTEEAAEDAPLQDIASEHFLGNTILITYWGQYREPVAEKEGNRWFDIPRQ
jgi:hypothetical protein